MFKFKPIDIIFGVLLVLMFIPKTKSLIQESLFKAIGVINPTTAIEADEQINIKSYKGLLKGINRSQDINFKDLEGKVVLVNYWATWCPPCVAEMPSLQKTYDTYKDKVVFLFITDDSAKATNSFLHEHNYTMPCYHVGASLPSQLDYHSYPTTFLIGKNGNIVVKKTGGANWNSSKIKTIINQLIKE